LNTNGLGRITPNDNGVLLEIGQSYKLQAAPAAGFVFSNWTGTVKGTVVLSSGKADLDFAMQSNLVLTATFADVERPLVTITYLKSNQRVSNAVYTVTGTASDNWAVAGVWVQLNNGNWTNASPAGLPGVWKQWAVGVNLVTAGANTLRAYAVDTSGNHSLTNTVHFSFVPPPAGTGDVGSGGVITITVSAPLPGQGWTGRPSAVIVNNTLQMRLSGLVGAQTVVESSTDLIHWSPVETNTMPSGGLPLTVPINSLPAQYYRTVPQ
jgi:Divergent InlB B-repeat domain